MHSISMPKNNSTYHRSFLLPLEFNVPIRLGLFGQQASYIMNLFSHFLFSNATPTATISIPTCGFRKENPCIPSQPCYPTSVTLGWHPARLQIPRGSTMTVHGSLARIERHGPACRCRGLSLLLGRGKGQPSRDAFSIFERTKCHGNVTRID